MDNNSWRYESLSDRNHFNLSVQHIKTVLGILDRVGAKENLADVVLEMLDDKALQPESLHPIVNVVLRDKLGYRSKAVNLLTVNENPAELAEGLKKWNGVDIVVLYHHPELGPLLLNPKNEAHYARLDRLSRYELLDIYVGAFGKNVDAGMLDKAAAAVADLFAGKSAKALPSFLKGDCVFRSKAPKAAPRKAAAKAAPAAKATRGGVKAPALTKADLAKRGRGMAAPAAPEPKPQKAAVVAEAAAAAVTQAPSAGKRITPMYSVDVTNELFHNGNVEAWKRIVGSYHAKHPDCQVMVYYDGERITDLNSLFKWGKVKRGTSIQFKVCGENIADVAKLVRYLAQGASHMFEAFLKGPVNSILPLF